MTNNIILISETLLKEAEYFQYLVQFYDGICGWEQESTTPVLHEGWVKPMVKTFMSFDHSVRLKVNISVETGRGGNNSILCFGEPCVPDSINIINNNYKQSLEETCDNNLSCDKTTLGHNIYLQENFIDQSLLLGSENFETMATYKMVKIVKKLDENEPFGLQNLHSVKTLLDNSSEKLFNIYYLLGREKNEPFVDLESFCNFEPYCCNSELINSNILEEETKVESQKVQPKFNLTLQSVKMGALKEILQAEKMNASALHLQLTAQTQSEAKKQRSSFDSETSRSKRMRKE